MSKSFDEKIMAMTIKLAEKGEGLNTPNPLVGTIIVKDKKIISRGYHKIAGTDHAEIVAIKKLSEKIKGHTLYVNLEPCAHYGKTPPCSDRIIEEGIKKVVIGAIDPDKRTMMKGITKLLKNNVKVRAGICNKEAVLLNEHFFMAKKERRPFVIGKYAMTLEGKIATEVGDSKWISNEKSRKIVQELRKKVDAILVGVGTVKTDNPSLTYRPDKKEKHIDLIQPWKIILDPVLEIPEGSVVVNTNPEKTILFCLNGKRTAKNRRLRGKGLNVIELDKYPFKAEDILDELYKKEIYSVLVEGGGGTLGTFFRGSLIDRLYVFIGSIAVGGDTSPTPFDGEGILRIENSKKFIIENCKKIDNNIFIEYISEEYSKCLQDWLKEQEDLLKKLQKDRAI